MNQRILLFDDDYESMEPFKRILERHGYDVELSAAQVILSHLATTRYNLVCVDFMIHPQSPDSSDQTIDNVIFDEVNWKNTGQEFLHRLRRGDFVGERELGTPPTVPVIVISATANAQERGEADYVFEKPFDALEVLDKIKELL